VAPGAGLLGRLRGGAVGGGRKLSFVGFLVSKGPGAGPGRAPLAGPKLESVAFPAFAIPRATPVCGLDGKFSPLGAQSRRRTKQQSPWFL
jgi:hypothetical protein